jgi:ribonuclease-3
MPPVSDPLAELERRLGYRFHDRGLLEAALTHRSHAQETGGAVQYERLEFLGDAVLGLAAAERLYRGLPAEAEGELSRLKAWVVSAESLARHAEALGLGELLRLGVGEERTGGRRKRSLLADALEALFGAVYLDGGPTAALALLAPYLEGALAADPGRAGDAKTRLQEAAQARSWELPAYRIAGESGPDHAKRFEVEVLVRGEIAGRGEGRSKKEAQQAAAAAALAALDSSEPPEAAGATDAEPVPDDERSP